MSSSSSRSNRSRSSTPRGSSAASRRNVGAAKASFTRWIRNSMGQSHANDGIKETVQGFIPVSSTQPFLSALANARSGWNPTSSAMNNLYNLIETGLSSTGSQQIKIVRDANPAALALALLDYRLRNESSMTEDQRNRRFVMVINGKTNENQPQSMARSIDPSNIKQMLALTASIAGGQSSRGSSGNYATQMVMNFGTDTALSSDAEAYKFSYFHSIASITLKAVNPLEYVDEHGNLVPDSPDVVEPDHQQPFVPLVRRSARIAAAGSTSGAFFRYWLSESFPESLSFIQVYKKSETKKLVKDLSTKGSWAPCESFELSCLANSIILQELPSSKFLTLFEHTCANGNLSFPSSRMSHLAKALGITICLSTYTATRMTHGRRQKTFKFAEEGDEKVYFIGRVGDHYVPDFESDWTRYAIRHYMKFKEIGGRTYWDLPLYRVKQLKSAKPCSTPPYVIFKTRSDEPYATYGELLSVLLWGYSEADDVVVDNGGDASYHQHPFVESMTVEDICLRAELYMYFQSMMRFVDLPNFSGDPEGRVKFVADNTRVVDKYRYSALTFQPFSADPATWGSATLRRGNITEYDVFRTQYEKEGGAKKLDAWMFPDRHAIKTVYSYTAVDDSVQYVPFSVPLPYTMVTFDTETFSVSAKFADRIVKTFHRKYSHHSNRDYISSPNGSPPDVYTNVNVDDVLTSEGVCEWEDASMVLEEGEDDDVDDSQKTVHFPYCVSVCYYVDIFWGAPINFRYYLVDHFGVSPSISPNKYRLVKKTFVGLDCMIQLSVFLGSALFRNVSVHLIAHNARYDVNMLMRYSFAIIADGIFQSTGKMNVCDLVIQAFPDLNYTTLDAAMMKGQYVYRRTNVWQQKKHIRVQCSLACTGIPLSAFASTFDMKIAKEYMPYSVFTLTSLFDSHVCDNDQELVVKCRDNSIVNIDDVWALTTSPSKKEFEESVRNAEAFEIHSGKTYMNLWRYARYYCEMDCEVLLVGFLSLRREMYHLKILSSPEPPSRNTIATDPFIDEENSPDSELMMENAVSLPQFASHYFGLNGVFEDVYECRGSLMNYIRRGVCGGKTMLAANSPVFHDSQGVDEDTVEDLDAVNLYGSAMYEIAKELGGFPKGPPQIWMPFGGCEAYSKHIPTFVSDSHYYFVLISINKLGRPLRFPIVNGPREIFPNASIFRYWEGTNPTDGNEEGFDSAEDLYEKLVHSANSSSRHFTNHPEGARMVVDKITFEDILNFHHGADVNVYQALYWDEGGNKNIGAVMEYLFADRVKKQQQGKKAAAQARKLTMNAGYGRFLMAAPDSNYHFIEGKDNIHRYVARHSCTTKETSFIRDDFAVVERAKGIQKFYNSSHLGAMVLSVSKRIMNRVMVTYEDLFSQGHLGSTFGMFYQDTDSIHIVRKHINLLFRLYTEKYGKKILVRAGGGSIEGSYSISKKELGAFCTDFEPVPGHTPPVSELFIGVMKKVYVDCMSCNALEGGKRKDTYHARMKGIPKKCVEMTAFNDGMNLRQLFEMIFMGSSIVFDLAKYSVRFDMGKDFSVSTNVSFKRVVRLNFLHILLAHIEWVKSGWSQDSFPYSASMTRLKDQYGCGRVNDIYNMMLKFVRWDRVVEDGKKNFLMYGGSSAASPTHPTPNIYDLLLEDDGLRLNIEIDSLSSSSSSSSLPLYQSSAPISFVNESVGDRLDIDDHNAHCMSAIENSHSMWNCSPVPRDTFTGLSASTTSGDNVENSDLFGSANSDFAHFLGDSDNDDYTFLNS